MAVNNQEENMSKILTKAVFIASGVALMQMSTMAAAQTKTATEKTVAIKAEPNMARSLAGPLTMTREQRLAAKPVDWKAATGVQKQSAMSADDKAAQQAAKAELSDGGAPNSSADDEARRDFSEEWKAIEQQDR
jgi:hypothetical protein